MRNWMLGLLVAIGLAGPSAPAAENELSVRLAEAARSTDVSPVVKMIPTVERLWPDNPDAYAEGVLQLARALNAHGQQPAAQNALTNLFAGFMNRPVPAARDAAATWLETKTRVIEECLRLDQLAGQRMAWSAVAGEVGGIRKQTIPDYANRGSLNPAGVFDGPDRRKEALRQNDLNRALDQWQGTLRVSNSKLTGTLLRGVKTLTVNDPSFREEIAAAARLTDEEKRQLL